MEQLSVSGEDLCILIRTQESSPDWTSKKTARETKSWILPLMLCVLPYKSVKPKPDSECAFAAQLEKRKPDQLRGNNPPP